MSQSFPASKGGHTKEDEIFKEKPFGFHREEVWSVPSRHHKPLPTAALRPRVACKGKNGLAFEERPPVFPHLWVIFSLPLLFFLCYSEHWNKMYCSLNLYIPCGLVLSCSRFLYSNVCGRDCFLGNKMVSDKVGADEHSGKSELCKHWGMNCPVTPGIRRWD